MTKIRTAEEVFLDLAGITSGCTKETAIHCMKEYVKQFIDLAADEAQARMRYGHSMASPEVDKESILKLKEMVR